MRILILTQFSKLGGSSRIQVIQFFPYLEKAGISFTHRAVYSDRFYRVQNGIVPVPRIAKKINFLSGLASSFAKKLSYVVEAKRYDAILIQREVFPKMCFRILRWLNPRVIYEIEDTIFEVNPFWKRGIIHEWALRYQARTCLHMMRHAAFVIAENEYLAAEARKHNSRVSVLSAPIDVHKFIPPPARKNQDRVTIGWMGSPSTTYLLKQLEPVWSQLGKQFSNVQLKTVGAASDFSASGIPLIKKEWKLDEELADLQSFDIGIMPLDDLPFNRGRLGYKMIQYMSVGIPIVAADIGLNRTVVRTDGNGFLVRGNEEWVEKLGLLVRDPGLRERLGANARKTVEERFSLEEQSKILIDALRDVARE